MKKISLVDCKFSFSRSSGAGGQNVNKLNTKVTLIWDIESSSLYSDGLKARFKKKYSRLIHDGQVVIQSQRYRTQSKNKDDCIDKLNEYLQSVEQPPKMRKKTRPSRAAVKKRLEAKKLHSDKKKSRSEKF